MTPILFAIILIGTIYNPLQSCKGKIEKVKSENAQSTFLYKNHVDTAQYVGKETCKQCHQSIYESYSQTQMGRSLKKATLENSHANFKTHQPIYDNYKNLYYMPVSKGDSIYIKEFRLSKNKRDTIYLRIEKIDYIIGSGHHTNSHLMQTNGYIHQMPLTFYTQSGHWDLPPGFEDGGNTSFERNIEVECMTCHNGFPKYVEGSENKYDYIPEGIDCERCHGPGSIHVKEKMSGKLVDIQNEIDYSIVNPAKLSPKLQMDVCQRCHLQGISVLKEGKSFFDFKPGMKLNEVFDVYQSRFTDSLSSFLMASQADRLRMSKCYIESHKGENGVTCITCHNPHKSVTEVPDEYFNSKCITCHQTKECTESELNRMTKNNNCIVCHMASSPSYDIPHVSITDHKISRSPIERKINKEDVTRSELEKQKDFIKLICRTTTEPNNKLNAKAYLNYFEKYAPNPKLLATAEQLLKKYPNQNEVFDQYVRLYFLKGDYLQVEALSKQKTPFQINSAWTNYRIGQSLMDLKKDSEALPFMLQSVKLAPFDENFSQKLASNYIQLQMHTQAYELLKNLSKNFPKNGSIQNDFGYCIVLMSKNKEDLLKSETYFKRALELNPDLVKALENMMSLYLNIGENEKAHTYLNRLLEMFPENKDYQRLKRQFNP